jgi:hypothetical protein
MERFLVSVREIMRFGRFARKTLAPAQGWVEQLTRNCWSSIFDVTHKRFSKGFHRDRKPRSATVTNLFGGPRNQRRLSCRWH